MLKPVICVLMVLISVCRATDFPVPPEWSQAVADFDMLYYGADDSYLAPPLFPASLGNGNIAFELGNPRFYMTGVFNGFNTTTPSHRAALPALFAQKFESNSPTQSLSTLCAALDLKNGIYYRRLLMFDSETRRSVVVEQRLYAHQTRSDLFVVEIELLEGKQSHSLSTNQKPSAVHSWHLKMTAFESNASTADDLLWRDVSNKTPGFSAMLGVIRELETPDSTYTQVAIVFDASPTFDLNSHTPYAFFLASVTSTLDGASTDCVLTAFNNLRAAAQAQSSSGHRALFDEHSIAWQQLSAPGVTVCSADSTVTEPYCQASARPDVALAVNASLYYLRSSLRVDRPYSLAPGGLAGAGYNGHTFWDTETWMFPTFATLHPSLSHSLLLYRFNRLRKSYQKAKLSGYDGAMFSWESGRTGAETCPEWAPEGKREIHISGDIAFAIQQHFRLTNDVQFLREIGFPLLSGIADFWVSRSETDQPGGVVHLRDVIGPDEDADHVDDSVYTNTVARISLRFAIEAALLLNLPYSPSWSYVAERLVIVFNQTLQYHPEFQGYPLGQRIKQADAVLLGFPLNEPMEPQVRRNDLDYYGAYTRHDGPAMTWGMHAIGNIELSDFVQASALFNRSFANSKLPFGIWTETPDGGATNFATGQGGFLQVMLFGWPGMRIMNGSLTFRPELPENVGFYRVRALKYRRNEIDVSYTAQTVRVELAFNQSQSDRSQLCVVSANSTRPLCYGVDVLFDRQAFTIVPCTEIDGRPILCPDPPSPTPAPEPSNLLIYISIGAGGFVFLAVVMYCACCKDQNLPDSGTVDSNEYPAAVTNYQRLVSAAHDVPDPRSRVYSSYTTGQVNKPGVNSNGQNNSPTLSNSHSLEGKLSWKTSTNGRLEPSPQRPGSRYYLVDQ